MSYLVDAVGSIIALASCALLVRIVADEVRIIRVARRTPRLPGMTSEQYYAAVVMADMEAETERVLRQYAEVTAELRQMKAVAS